MRSARRNILGSGLVVALAVLPAGAAARPEDSQTPWEPPVFSFEGGRIGLLEAVRLTLANDPNLLLQAEDVRFQLGIAEELAGDFNWTLNGQFTWQHREQELLQSTRQAEEDKRNGIRDAQATACGAEEDLGLKVEELETAQMTPGTEITSDPQFDFALRVVDNAIQSADSEAQRMELVAYRSDLIAGELETTTTNLGNAALACTEAGESLERLGEVPDEEEFDSGQLELRLDKLTRSGLFWSPFLRGVYNSTEFVGKQPGYFVPLVDANGEQQFSPSGIPLERLIDFGGKNLDDVYTFEVGFDVNVPLLRGRGRAATAAGESAARVDYEASELFLEHSASVSVLNTVFGYWNLVASQEQYDISQSSADLQARVVEVTRALIEANELPAVELARSLASEANARARLESSARDLAVARLDLVRVIGLSVQGEENVPTALDAFPPAPSSDDVGRSDEAGLIREALGNRLDIEAAASLTESGRILARAATINLKPQFDVNGGAWTIARGEQSVSAATDDWVGPSWKLGAFLEKPFGNNTARGRLVQREAQLRQRQISEADLGRVVRINVVATRNALLEALGELAFAEQAAQSFEETYRAEVEKLQLGETTVLDTILTEQQWTNSRLALVRVRLQVATLIAQLRFETGTMLEQGQEGNRISMERLTTLPEVGQD